MSDVTHSMSDVTHIMSDITHIMSDIKHIMSDVTHIMSDITHIMSDVTHIMSDVTHIMSDMTRTHHVEIEEILIIDKYISMLVCTYYYTWNEQGRSWAIGVCNCNSNIFIFKPLKRIQRSHSSTKHLES